MNLFNKVKKVWFLFAMFIAIFLSMIIPELGRTGGTLHLDILTQAGISLIFFLYGIGLSSSAFKLELSNWPLHLYIQLSIFALYPLLWLLLGPIFLTYMPSALAFGFCYLFTLPSTLSSSVAMTSIAKGNVSGAVFNACLSNIIGVLITPILIHFFIGGKEGGVDFLNSLLSIGLLILLPMLIGQIMRTYLIASYKKYKIAINRLDKLIILIIIYNTFSDSFFNDIWSQFSLELLLSLIFTCLFIIFMMSNTILYGARYVKLPLRDEAAAVFCGTKKTLSAGIPMAKILFLGNPDLGMVILPIMLYHPIQIFYCSILANRYEKTEQS